MRHLVGTKRSSIVATHLIDTSAERSRTVILTDNHIVVAREATLEVRTYRSDENHEQIFSSRMHTHLCARSNEQRADVKRRTSLIWRNETLIQAHHLINHLVEFLGRQFRHQNATASALQTCCILIAAEHSHLAVRTAVSLQSFKSLLSVMQTSGSHVKWNCLFGANFYFAPFAVTEVTAYIVIGLVIAKAKA